MARRVAFLDRDGTINVDRGYVHRIEDWEFVAGAVDAITMLRSAGFSIAVVTNQSAIAAGKYTPEDVDRLHAFMRQQLARAGTDVDAIVFCTHGPLENCLCRKPRTGLVGEVERQLGTPIDYANSWTIGDKLSDLEFGRNLGTRTGILKSEYWQPADLPSQPDIVADSLFLAATAILRR